MVWRSIQQNLPTSALVQTVAVFILLSVNGECLQCYWCGPLAEQIHRSPRAAPCGDGENQVTTCETGYTHCAVVASSPPFVESRYCVKFYQDECYTLYCNTTKTYKVTCPCRGELCNGPKTDREIEAFNALTKSVAKNQKNRIKKRNAIDSHNFIQSEKMKASLVVNDPDDVDSKANEVDEKAMEDNTIQTGNPTLEHNNSSNPNDMEINSTEMNVAQEEHVEMTTSVDNISSLEAKLTTNNKKIETTTATVDRTEIIDITTTMKAIESTLRSETTKADENMYISNEIKPSMQMLTAEALQQNANPVTTEKPIEFTTTEITSTSTAKNAMENSTPKPSTNPRNSSAIFSFNILMLLACLILNSSL